MKECNKLEIPKRANKIWVSNHKYKFIQLCQNRENDVAWKKWVGWGRVFGFHFTEES